MKLLPFVVLTLLVTTGMGVGMAPLSEAPSESQADAIGFEPSYTVQTDDTAEADSGVIHTSSIPAEEIDRSDIHRQHVDLGPSAGFDTDATTERIVTETVRQDLESTESDTERVERIDTELDGIEAEIDDLEAREQSAIRSFSANQIAPRELVAELARIHLTADVLRDRVALLDTQAPDVDSEAVSNRRFERIEYDLRMFEGPVRAYTVDVLRGEQPSDRIMIEASDDAVTLAALDDGQYIREVNRRGLRGEESNEFLNDTEVENKQDRAVELSQQQYPRLWGLSSSWSSDGPGSVVMVSVTLDQGALQTFTDGPTEQTFIEHQRLSLDAVVTGETETKFQDGLNVTVGQTYAGGPLRLTVTDEETGEPLETTVTVGQNGQESTTVGTTNTDGTLWMVSPRQPFTITVFGEDNSAAFVDITPPAPKTVPTTE